MDIVVNARDAEVSAALRAATRERVTAIERFASDVRLVEVDYSRSSGRRDANGHKCEILVHLKRRLVKGSAAASEPPAALELAVDKVVGQMRRLHERRLHTWHGTRRGGRGATSGHVEMADAGDDEADDADAVGDLPLEVQFVKTKRFASKPMDPAEAALQMELLGHDFFLFTSTESGRAAVVYRRRDGRLGLIEATG